MHVSRRLLMSVLMLGALALAVPAATLASGGGSAGDQQYTDPFAGTPTPNSAQTTSTRTATPPPPVTTAAPAPAASTPAPAASTPAPAASTPVPTYTAPATAPPAASTDPTTATATTAGPTTLAFTGYDSWLAAGLGAALIAGGLIMRRWTRRT